jgi:hypothetical protein
VASSYVSFLKQNGVRSPRGNRSYDNEEDDTSILDETTARISNTARNQRATPQGVVKRACFTPALAHEIVYPSPSRGECRSLGGSLRGVKGETSPSFSPSPYRIIQENYGQDVKIFDLTNKDVKKSYANKVTLSVYKSRRNEIESYLQKYTFCWRYSKDFDTIIIEQYNIELLRWSMKSFDIYKEQTLNYCHFILVRYKQDHMKKFFIPLMNRYSKGCRDKVKKRMNYVIHRYRNSSVVSLTLTIDPQKYAYDKYLMWSGIKKDLNRFLTDLKYYFKKRGLPVS